MSARAPLPPERLNTINRLTLTARLLSSAVHDTRNALQIITGHAELFAETSANAEKSRERSQAILTHADRASRRMQSLVLMAQETDSVPERLDLRALTEGAVALRRSSFGRARIKVVIQPPTGEYWVRACRADLIRVVANLMLNAERAVTGRPAAEISFRVFQSGGRVGLAVKDNGTGVPEEVVPFLFSPFTPGPGPGLGLYVSRWLMERGGGTVELTGNRSGAEFSLELPGDAGVRIGESGNR